MSSAESRAATRDRWQAGTVATRAAVVLDYTLATLFTLALALIGSLNL